MRGGNAVSTIACGISPIDESEPWRVFDSLPIGVIVRSAEGTVLYVNAAYHDILGSDGARSLNHLVVRPEGEDRLPALGCRRARHYRRADGRTVRVVETETPMMARSGRPVFLSTLTDVTFLADPIRSDGERLRTILAQGPIGVSVSRRDTGRIIFANSRFAQLMGMPLSDVIGSRAADFYVDEEQRLQVIAGLKETGSVVNQEVCFRRADGTPFWTLFTVNGAIIDDVSVNLAWIYDYTERRAMEDTLREMASRDYLTGIFNRRCFMEMAQQQLSRTVRFSESMSVMVLDLDHFKLINDTYGHAAGDEALRGVAGACVAALRDYDILGRLGGEEFVVALPGTAPEDALGVAERLRRTVARTSFVSLDPDFELTVSIGIAAIDGPRDSLEKAIHRADIALYRSKRLGRNRSSIFRPEML